MNVLGNTIPIKTTQPVNSKNPIIKMQDAAYGNQTFDVSKCMTKAINRVPTSSNIRIKSYSCCLQESEVIEFEFSFDDIVICGQYLCGCDLLLVSEDPIRYHTAKIDQQLKAAESAKKRLVINKLSKEISALTKEYQDSIYKKIR